MTYGARPRRTRSSSCSPAPGRPRPPELFVQAARAGRRAEDAHRRRRRPSSAPSTGALPEIVAGSVAPLRRADPGARLQAAAGWTRRRRVPGGRSSSTARATCRTPTPAGRTTTASSCSTPCSTRARLRRARHGLPRLVRLRPRLAHRDLPPDGHAGARGSRGRRRLAGRRARRRPRSGSASTAAATAAS